MNQYLILLLLVSYCIIAHSQTLKVYKHVDAEGVMHYSSKKPVGKKYNILMIRCPECGWKNTVNWHTTPLITDKYITEINTAAKKWGIDSALIKAVIHAESSFIANNQSSAGAQGLMQLMPATQKIYAVTDPFDPTQNINAGTELLKHLLETYNNNLQLSLAAYNAGEGAVKKYNNSVPPYEETENYIKRVNILKKRYK
ncbi:MAG: lytic transglycosylase domain-containing protein [Proteobacteria bacterium]|nr:lytic transglycosylase domain-containing protein [Pseudomonadota bacterium]